MSDIILISIILILLFVISLLIRRIHTEKSRQLSLQKDYQSLYIKHGKAWEHFVPFTPNFERIASKENFRFMGSPIDGIAFDDNAIKFIEIKTGKSQLNKKQKKIKQQVKDQKVEWHELRYEK